MKEVYKNLVIKENKRNVGHYSAIRWIAMDLLLDLAIQ